MAKFEQALSTPIDFSWLTRITFGANWLLISLVTDSIDETKEVFKCLMLVLSPNCSKWRHNACLLAELVALSALIDSIASSGTSVPSGSFLANHLCSIVFESAVKKRANSGQPNCSINLQNAGSLSWVYPSKTNLHLYPDFWASVIIEQIYFSTSAIGTSPSNGSSSEPRVPLTVSDILFISRIV